MTRGALFLVALATAAHVLSGPADGLQHLSRFISSHYCEPLPLATHEISFTAPLIGEPVTFLHFTWHVVSRDQYGRKLKDELNGLVQFGPGGDLRHFVVSGPLVRSSSLRNLRNEIRHSHKWPAKFQHLKFGPQARSEDVSRSTTAAAETLLGRSLQSVSATFYLLKQDGESDATWYVVVRDADAETFTVRVEPFTGRVVQVDVSSENRGSR